MVKGALKAHIEEVLGQRVAKIEAISGGDINEVYILTTKTARVVLKKNSASRYPKMLSIESDGLQLIAKSNTLKTPSVFGHFEFGGEQGSLLEWIEPGKPRADFWEVFGQQLAAMHGQSRSRFGLDHDNYIGTLRQSNTIHLSWVEFFIHCRLTPLIKVARDQGLMDNSESRLVENAFDKLSDYFPAEQASLLHGDLWSGNYLIDMDGMPVIIDPAVYYGHRYMDFGMMELFGGFNDRLFSAYNEVSPLDADWKAGAKKAQLYPLLVHLILFGRTYWSRIESILKM